jgi:hypothetical protein
MNIASDWRLTIHYWPRATEAGVRPQRSIGFSFDESPALYRAHELDFTRPPSREDFHAVVARTPWMTCWEETLLPVLALNHWPMITPGHKGASVDLKDASGQVVGHLEVWRRDRYCNTPCSLPFFGTYPGSDIDRFLKRRVRDKAKRQAAREHVEAQRHLIMERVVNSDDPSPMQMLDEVARACWSRVGSSATPSVRRSRPRRRWPHRNVNRSTGDARAAALHRVRSRERRSDHHAYAGGA